MPTTRRQAAAAGKVGFCLTLDDTAKKLTRISGLLHSTANLINDTIEGRPGFFERIRRSGENSSANARALWRFHDRRWEAKEGGNNNDDDNEDDDEEDAEPIDDEIDRRIGRPFTFTRAVEVVIDCLENARDILRDRKAEMESWTDTDGALTLAAFVENYEKEIENWTKVKRHLALCSTFLGESFLDSSLRYGWL